VNSIVMSMFAIVILSVIGSLFKVCTPTTSLSTRHALGNMAHMRENLD
jgi:hypothetical protein